VAIESDKMGQEIRSTHAGELSEILFEEGSEVKVGEVLFKINTDVKGTLEAAPATPAAAPTTPAPGKAASPPKAPTPASPVSKATQHAAASSTVSGERGERREKMSKMRKRIAERLKIA
jgi:pyruvate/2-oxoglutarate dehydrogenase complex dihydrolipoamide acyltransferase (E2) component